MAECLEGFMKLVVATSEKKKTDADLNIWNAVSAKGRAKVSKEDQGTNVVSSVFIMCPTTVGLF